MKKKKIFKKDLLEICIGKKSWISFFQNLYRIISIFSTLTIFSGLVLFLYGKMVKSNQSDNDLIMTQIKNELDDSEIYSITTTDIHGFGNNSIIVTAGNRSWDENDSNKIVILDLISNEILRNMDDLFGMRASYKTTFSYSLESENITFQPETEYVLDIIGDSTKEIIVKYFVEGSTYGANSTGIFRYSYENEKYQLIGTYPESKKMDVGIYDNNGNLIGFHAQKVFTDFNYVRNKDGSYIQCFDGSDHFLLNAGSWYNREYWIDSSVLGRCLVTLNDDKYYENLTYINVYDPIYDKQDFSISWNLLYSENIKEFPHTYSQDDLMRALMKILDGTITIIDKCC